MTIDLDAMARQVLAWLGSASWQLAVLVALVGLLTRCWTRMPARLNHALWCLVLVKALLPPGLSAPWSLSNWGVPPLQAIRQSADWPSPAVLLAEGELPRSPVGDGDPSFRALTPEVCLAGIWLLGCVVFGSLLAGRYVQLLRRLRGGLLVDEGPIRVALERVALAGKFARTPELVLLDRPLSPFLVGLWRPRIVLSQRVVEQLDQASLEAVLAHELVHWRHGDLWIGWWQSLVQGLFWFHPLVWWANTQLREGREWVCDETVLRMWRVKPADYGEALLRVLTSARGRVPATAVLSGVFEQGSQIQKRLEQVMQFQGYAGPRSKLYAAVFVIAAVALLPMAPSTPWGGLALAEGDRAAKTSYPQIIKTVPERGAVEVDAGIAEIAVTFDRDMAGGMSWTGAAPLFPPVDKQNAARWIDARTCVLPVKLKKGSYYRVGLNSTSHHNFKSAAGVPLPPAVICFATQEADESVQAHVKGPQIVSLEPKNGADDVAPGTRQLRVTFDLPMEAGMSWTGGGPEFPELPKGEKASWSEDGRTCTLPVKLAPGRAYRLGLNSRSHLNFASQWGVPLEPVVYEFRTASE